MVEYSPFDRDIVHNPFPVYRALRDDAPVYHNEQVGFWALSRYDDVVAAHLETDVFSSAEGVTIEGIDQRMPFLIVKESRRVCSRPDALPRLSPSSARQRPACWTRSPTPTSSAWSSTSR